MGTPSLLQTSRRACIKYVKRIQNVGFAPYDLIRPILQKVENPSQLHQLELNSPHLTEHDAELWVDFIKRDIPFWEEITLPDKPNYDVYCSLRKQVASEVDEDAERMKKALRRLDKQKRKHSSKFVDPDKMGLPKEKPTAAQKFAVYDRMMGGIEPVFALNTPKEGSKGLTPYDNCAKWRIEKPKLPPKAPTPKKSALPAAVKRNDRLSIPTHRLSGMASKVVKAPRSFVEEYKSDRLAANKPPPPRNSISSGKTNGQTSQGKGLTSTATGMTPRNIDQKSHQPQGLSHAKHPSQIAKPNSMAPKPRIGTTSDLVGSSASSSRPASSPSASSHPQVRPHPHAPDSQPANKSTAQDNSDTRQAVARKPVPRPTATKRPAVSPLLSKPKKTRVT